MIAIETPWYPLGSNPFRRGPYRTKVRFSPTGETEFRFWDYRCWGLGAETPEEATWLWLRFGGTDYLGPMIEWAGLYEEVKP